VDDAELFFHSKRMSRLTRALKAPLDQWEGEILARIREEFGDGMAKRIRAELDEAFIELATSIDLSIEN
jgi:hypothetical protein